MSASAPQTAAYPCQAGSEHLAATAMWGRMLGHVPTLLGKLVSVASFRVGLTVEYRHPTLDRILSPEICSRVLRESHEHLFAEWVGLFVEEQAEDLQQYLESFRRGDARGLLRKASENLVPAGVHVVAHHTFHSDLESILASDKPARDSGGPAVVSATA
jgi:hypothetical protein